MAPVAADGRRPDGTLTMTLDVCNDWALRSWILGFGPLARVDLAAGARDADSRRDRTRARHVPVDFELPAVTAEYATAMQRQRGRQHSVLHGVRQS